MTTQQRKLVRLGWVGAAVLMVTGVALLDLVRRKVMPPRRPVRRRLLRDYSRRSGYPRPASDMRGAASDFTVPKGFRIPEALRPWGS